MMLQAASPSCDAKEKSVVEEANLRRTAWVAQPKWLRWQAVAGDWVDQPRVAPADCQMRCRTNRSSTDPRAPMPHSRTWAPTSLLYS
jgi:hypothetical protein